MAAAALVEVAAAAVAVLAAAAAVVAWIGSPWEFFKIP